MDVRPGKARCSTRGFVDASDSFRVIGSWFSGQPLLVVNTYAPLTPPQRPAYAHRPACALVLEEEPPLNASRLRELAEDLDSCGSVQTASIIRDLIAEIEIGER